MFNDSNSIPSKIVLKVTLISDIFDKMCVPDICVVWETLPTLPSALKRQTGTYEMFRYYNSGNQRSVREPAS